MLRRLSRCRRRDVLVVVLFLSSPLMHAAADDSAFCRDLKAVVAAARGGFASIRGARTSGAPHFAESNVRYRSRRKLSFPGMYEGEITRPSNGRHLVAGYAWGGLGLEGLSADVAAKRATTAFDELTTRVRRCLPNWTFDQQSATRSKEYWDGGPRVASIRVRQVRGVAPGGSPSIYIVLRSAVAGWRPIIGLYVVSTLERAVLEEQTDEVHVGMLFGKGKPLPPLPSTGSKPRKTSRGRKTARPGSEPRRPPRPSRRAEPDAEDDDEEPPRLEPLPREPDLSDDGVTRAWVESIRAAARRVEPTVTGKDEDEPPAHTTYLVTFRDTGYVMRTDTCIKIMDHRPTAPTPYYAFASQTVYIDDKSPIMIGQATDKLGAIEELSKPDSYGHDGFFFHQPGKRKPYREDEVIIEPVDDDGEYEQRVLAAALDIFTGRLTRALERQAATVKKNLRAMRTFLLRKAPADARPLEDMASRHDREKDAFSRVLDRARTYASSKGLPHLARALDPANSKSAPVRRGEEQRLHQMLAPTLLPGLRETRARMRRTQRTLQEMRDRYKANSR